VAAGVDFGNFIGIVSCTFFSRRCASRNGWLN
jgi:hypothetical protein